MILTFLFYVLLRPTTIEAHSQSSSSPMGVWMWWLVCLRNHFNVWLLLSSQNAKCDSRFGIFTFFTTLLLKNASWIWHVPVKEAEPLQRQRCQVLMSSCSRLSDCLECRSTFIVVYWYKHVKWQSMATLCFIFIKAKKKRKILLRTQPWQRVVRKISGAKKVDEQTIMISLSACGVAEGWAEVVIGNRYLLIKAFDWWKPIHQESSKKKQMSSFVFGRGHRFVDDFGSY